MTRDSAQYRYVHGQLQRAKKPQQIRGLNQNHNHEMKEIFKGAATRALAFNRVAQEDFEKHACVRNTQEDA
jgi:hypothetical protein